MNERAISVVVPTRNRAALLPGLLASLAAQQFSPDRWELIVVDDGSTDETADVIGRFAKNAPMPITVIRQRNAGAGAARNAGAAAAGGRRLLFLDDDMIASGALVEEHARCVEAVATSVIGCIAVPPARRDPWTAWEDSQLAKLTVELTAGRPPGPRDFNSGNCSVPTRLFRAIGGFSSTLARGEDFQFGFRLADHGGRFVYNRRALCTHLGSHAFATWARNAEAFGRSEIALQQGVAPHALAEQAADWYRQRNILNRIAVRLTSGSAALRRPAVACIDAVGRAAHRLAVRALANAAYSAVYNILYWHGLIDSMGSDRFWSAVRQKTRTGESPKQNSA